MATEYTSDGYPYDTAGEWEFLRKANWKSNKASNDFLASIGERNFPGLKGAMQKLGAKGINWIATIVAGIVGTLTANPAIGVAIKTALSSGFSQQLDQLVTQAINDGIKTLGTNAFLNSAGALIYMEKPELDEIVNKWYALDEVARAYTMHHIINRWARNQKYIIEGSYGENDEAGKTYITVVLALATWGTEQTHHIFNKCPSGRAFFVNNGFKTWASHWCEQTLFNMNSQGDLDKLDEIGKRIGFLKIETDKQKYDAWASDLENYMNNSANKKIDKSEVPGILIGGVAVGKLLKWF